MKFIWLFILFFSLVPIVAQDVIITNDLQTILAKEGSIRVLSDSYEYIDYYDSGDEKKSYINKSEVKTVKSSDEKYLNEKTQNHMTAPKVESENPTNKESEKKPFGKQRVALSLSGLHFADHIYVAYERSLIKSDWLYFRASASVDIGGSILVPRGGLHNFFYDYNINGDILWVLNRNNKVFRNYVYTGFSYNQFQQDYNINTSSPVSRVVNTLAYNVGYGVQFKNKVGISPGFYTGYIRHLGLPSSYRQAGFWLTINIGYTF